MNQRASLILQAEGLSLERGGRKILNIKKLEFHKGIIYGLAGPAGSGKSSFLNVISGIEKPSAGTVLYDNKPFQSNWLGKPIQNPDIKIVGGNRLNGNGTGESIVRNTFPEKVNEIHKKHFLKSRFGQLWTTRLGNMTHGERAVLASILAVESDPRVLIMDDYGIYMTTEQESDYRKNIKNMGQNLGTTIILASQSDHFLRQFVSVMIYLDKGHVSKIRSGTKKQQRGKPYKKSNRR
ncbi:MAG: ATP-binding cassette domain-containing protein [Candidatus Marinimicrobia bacterium]|mgnify:FL=1|jgi:ABC-type branched-subunit amino acid transport system ATPase component|nr:ATP-binding cassette domain-containing protein [Candidatus Neomarinimicrobiota bacterium]MBT3617832.1 ATP-binding cassette domain-containing protein [Candidatus Neomarinimicrobiota bacterium]MBT3828189.1 ATP-binding cassette domain-containing protein [Candidatus Neomarinimicrobiota bacterium]MBT3997106.1 ATP-binding cassette domain-containing protein [Candidatus Neomarinimicrobiota bacterium]MBT4280572.1 ATP-binding cassette domain-containing protein [Candidatus Neomarinimicrobiota bacterium